MIDLLALLKRVEWEGSCDGQRCPGCDTWKYMDTTPPIAGAHAPACELKALIDGLEARRLVLVDTGAETKALPADSMAQSIARQIEDGGHGLVQHP